jgi:hypothetical protein
MFPTRMLRLIYIRDTRLEAAHVGFFWFHRQSAFAESWKLGRNQRKPGFQATCWVSQPERADAGLFPFPEMDFCRKP